MLTLLAVLTTSRRGEFCGLRWTDINEVDGSIHIQRTLYRAGAERGEKVPKGKRGRGVPINVELAAVLAKWRSRCDERAVEAGVTLVPDAFIVSPLPDGSRPVDPDTLSTFQSRLSKELGILLEGRNPFRHWGATEILGGGASPRDGADILGHSDVKTFLNRYTHATTERQRNAAAILGRVLAMANARAPTDGGT